MKKITTLLVLVALLGSCATSDLKYHQKLQKEKEKSGTSWLKEKPKKVNKGGSRY